MQPGLLNQSHLEIRLMFRAQPRLQRHHALNSCDAHLHFWLKASSKGAREAQLV